MIYLSLRNPNCTYLDMSQLFSSVKFIKDLIFFLIEFDYWSVQ